MLAAESALRNKTALLRQVQISCCSLRLRLRKYILAGHQKNENFENLGKFEAAKGGICNLFFQQGFMQINSMGNLARWRAGKLGWKHTQTEHGL